MTSISPAPREAVKMIGLVWTKPNVFSPAHCYTMEFETDTPFDGFRADCLPDEIECVEILDVVWAPIVAAPGLEGL